MYISNLESLDIEMAIVGHGLIDSQSADEIVDLPEKYFYHNKPKEIFLKIRELRQKNKKVDLILLREHFKNDKTMKKFIADCLETGLDISAFHSCCKKLQELWMKREIQKIGLMTKKIKDADTDELIATLSKTLQEIQSQKKKDLEQILDGIIHEYENLKSRGYEMSSGSEKLDDIICGFRRKRLYVLGGAPGSGKTGLALFWAQRLAFQNRKKVLFFSLEISLFDVIGRLTSILEKVAHYRIQKPWLLTTADICGLRRTAKKFFSLRNLLVETENWPIDQILLHIQKVKPDIVFIDHLQYIPLVSTQREKTHEILSHFVKHLRETAKRENLCIVLLSQTRRKYEKNGIPEQSDFKGSSGIEEQADIGMIIRRIYDKAARKTIWGETIPNNFYEIHVVKNRNGSMGFVPMLFDEKTLRHGEFLTNPTVKEMSEKAEIDETDEIPF